MYELRIGAYKGFDSTFSYINSSFIPRKGEIIKNYIIFDGDEDKRYNWTLEVQAVHYELFKDKSSMPVVYANVVSSKLVEEEENDENS